VPIIAHTASASALLAALDEHRADAAVDALPATMRDHRIVQRAAYSCGLRGIGAAGFAVTHWGGVALRALRDGDHAAAHDAATLAVHYGATRADDRAAALDVVYAGGAR